MYKITNIHMEGNEHGRLGNDIIYAELVDEDGSVLTCATLRYILQKIREENLQVENARVTYRDVKDKRCSKVELI